MRASFSFVAATCLLIGATALAQAPAGGTTGSQPAAQPAATATPALPPTVEQQKAARVAYGNGQTLFSASKYEEARAAFEEAYSLVPNPLVLLSVAECNMRLGKLEDAETQLRKYLADRPDAPDRAAVEKKIADLLATPSTLAISTTPQGAIIRLDGVDTNKRTPAEITTSHGAHQVEVSLDGYMPIAENIEIKLGARHEMQVSLQPAPQAPPPPPPPPPVVKPEPKPEPHKDADPTTALWITSILGATGIVTGTVLGFVVLGEQSDYDAHPTAESADRGERLALFADVALGVGAMSLITGAVLYLTHDASSSEPERATETSWTVTPVPTPHGAGLTAQVRY